MRAALWTDIIVVDENFGGNLMLGSTAISKLRANLSGGEVIIHCTAENAAAVTGPSCWPADVHWGKPYPDWRDGEMQRSLMPLLAERRPLAKPENKLAGASVMSVESSC